jgi:ribosomal protein L37AE/L43A
MSERAAPSYCPYCAEEDLRPVEEPLGAWLCTGCRRVFNLKFVGLSLPERSTS